MALTDLDIQRISDAVAANARGTAAELAREQKIPISNAELRDLIRDISRDTVKETLKSVGIDIADPETANIFRRISGFQKAVGQIVILAASGIIISIVSGLLWIVTTPWRK